VDPAYGEKYRDLYQNHWWWRARTELIVDELRRLPPVDGSRAILDIGCGDALFFDRLSEFGEVEGIEPCAELIDPANPHRARIHVGPFDESFQPARKYSLILMLDVLEHLDNPVGALRRVSELLEVNGKFVATVPAFMALWTNHDVINHHRTRYTKATLHEIAAQTDLRILEERYFYHWTCPVKLAVAIIERTFHSEPQPAQISARWINELLYRISRMEQRMLTPLSIAFGSSLLMIANK
jgi:2-polyprenyl-3-methyl-5-hydroxy-6-metoxy-1,4-benzoquinol methylase